MKLTPEPVAAVKHENFKTCVQSGFCKRNRDLGDAATAQASSWKSPYRIDAATVKFAGAKLTATILKTTGEGDIKLPLTISFSKLNTARVTIDEARRQAGDIGLRHDSKARKERYNEVDYWALLGEPEKSKTVKVLEKGSGSTRIDYGPDASYTAVLRYDPFEVQFRRNGETHIVFNQRGYMNVEHWRPKMEPKEDEKPAEGAEEQYLWWEESFGGNTDTKPRGPESVGLDISFPGYAHVYGVPEHTGPLSLKQTRYSLDLLPLLAL